MMYLWKLARICHRFISRMTFLLSSRDFYLIWCSLVWVRKSPYSVSIFLLPLERSYYVEVLWKWALGYNHDFWIAYFWHQQFSSSTAAAVITKLLEATFHFVLSDCRSCFGHQIADPATTEMIFHFLLRCLFPTRWNLQGEKNHQVKNVNAGMYYPCAYNIYDIPVAFWFFMPMGSLSAPGSANQTQLDSCRHHTTTPPFSSVDFQVCAPFYVLYRVLKSEKSHQARLRSHEPSRH